MQTLVYVTQDKSSWPLGPWDNEPDKKQWQDEKTGLPCLIVRGPLGALCGYVGVPPGFMFYGYDYDDIDVPLDVYGGITFTGSCSEGPEDQAICHIHDEGEEDNVWWIGFDCSHGGDLCPGPSVDPNRGNYRDFEFVEKEVLKLARQLKALEVKDNK